SEARARRRVDGLAGHQLEAARDLVAKRNRTGACGPIGAFVSQVQAQSGKNLTPAQASGFVTQANEVGALLVCRRRSARPVDLAAALPKLVGLLAQPLRERDRLRCHALLGGVLADLLRDLHRAELRPAHRAEVGDLRALRRQCLVMELARRVRIERKVELVLPAELEAGLADRVVPLARPR